MPGIGEVSAAAHAGESWGPAEDDPISIKNPRDYNSVRASTRVIKSHLSSTGDNSEKGSENISKAARGTGYFLLGLGIAIGLTVCLLGIICVAMFALGGVAGVVAVGATLGTAFGGSMGAGAAIGVAIGGGALGGYLTGGIGIAFLRAGNAHKHNKSIYKASAVCLLAAPVAWILLFRIFCGK